MAHQPTTFAELPLFTGAPMLDVFGRLDELLPHRSMRPSPNPIEWRTGAGAELPERYQWRGESRSTIDLLEQTDTVALLAIHRGRIRVERYFGPGGAHVRWLSMSVAKSVVSALVGFALQDGSIASLDEPISDYIPVERGSAYDGVRIVDVLQMSSGARWNEDYSDERSDARRLGRAMSASGSLDELIAESVREFEPGTVCRYNSADTQALGELLCLATGTTLAEFMQKKLVDPLGMADPGFWLTDARGREAAFAGLNLTARDYARVGELYRFGGVLGGEQLLDAEYVRDSVRATSPHTQPGEPLSADGRHELGYGYQWWIPDGDDDEFMAIGVYNQFIHVNRRLGTTVVKLSANQRYGTDLTERTNRDAEHLGFLRAVARTVSEAPRHD